ncbi:uncharacterized protein LOC122650481 [Telopea speciosissima]|uniref:uncharacterized protein LOC122650481 n=1 Tax=Telopea speciosissima TaxID=54955 RepID=UPI001CC7BB80|nr:uncharacterized protein LOC122650481 [Telopea speciosissima]
MDAKVTPENSFEWMLFSRQVIEFNRDSTLAWEIITLWIWLQELGIPQVILKLLTYSNALIRFLSNETLVCLDCIKTGRIPAPPLNEIPFMYVLTNRGISLQFLHNNRRQALEGMLKIMENIYARGFEDIAWQALTNSIQPALSEIRTIVTSLATQPVMTQILCRPIGIIGGATHNYGGTMVVDNRERLMIRPFGEGSSRGGSDNRLMIRPFGEEGSNSNRVFDTTIPIQIRPFGEGQSMNQALLSPFTESNLCGITRQLNIREEPEVERSMFMTFSKGYPVSLKEVQDFLTHLYGDCVEAIYMEKVDPSTVQPLYALVVFKQASTIDTILNGAEKVSFTINEKQAMVRRWKPK